MREREDRGKRDAKKDREIGSEREREREIAFVPVSALDCES